jgi:hypothetical protein
MSKAALTATMISISMEDGTRSAFCQGLAHPRRYYRARRRVYQH